MGRSCERQEAGCRLRGDQSRQLAEGPLLCADAAQTQSITAVKARPGRECEPWACAVCGA